MDVCYYGGDRVQMIAKGTPWEGEDPDLEGIWGTVTRGDETLMMDGTPHALVLVKWDVPAPGIVDRSLLRKLYVIPEEPS